MKKTSRYSRIGTGVLAFLFVVALTAAPVAAALQLGDPAPPLDVSEWIQGKPVHLSAGKDGFIYVIEFWEPDCPHCRESIPFLNMLHETYADQGVAVIGISGDSSENIRRFLETSEEPVEYAVGADAENRSDLAYMGGFGIDGVPHAFVVDRRGRIVWEGHPMNGLDGALAQIVSGRYDLNRRIQSATAKKLINAYVYLTRHTRETALLRQLGRRITTLAWDDARLLGRLADYIRSEKCRHPDLPLALRAAERALALEPGRNAEMEKTRNDLLLRPGRRADASPSTTGAGNKDIVETK